mgnify:CR=1 FL=1
MDMESLPVCAIEKGGVMIRAGKGPTQASRTMKHKTSRRSLHVFRIGLVGLLLPPVQKVRGAERDLVEARQPGRRIEKRSRT